MEQLNKVELRGVVGSVKQITYTDKPMVRISVATNYAYKDREGAAVIETSWHNVIGWQGRNIPDLVRLKKGDKVFVTGRLRYQKYQTADGMDRYSTDIIATQVQLIEDTHPLQYEMQ